MSKIPALRWVALGFSLAVLIVVGTYWFAPHIYWTAVLGLHEHGDAITLVSTAFVAMFTGTLWWSTDKLWRAGQESMELTARAFVYLEGFDTELTLIDDSESGRKTEPQNKSLDRAFFITRFAVRPRWKNSGATPATNMFLQVDWVSRLDDLPQDFAYEYRNTQTPMFIGPGAVEISDVIEMPGAGASVNNGQEGGPSLYIWGRAGYDDIFKKRHFVRWCYRVRFHRFDGGRLQASYIQYGDYNATDWETRLEPALEEFQPVISPCAELLPVLPG